MRLLIAMNVLLGLPDRIVKHPELFKLGGRKPEAVRGEIAKLHASLIGDARHHLHAQRRLAAGS